jgi:hypothetical protein
MNLWAKAATDAFAEALGIENIDPRFFREKNEGLFEILDRLTAEQASRRIPGCSSIVAHARHTLAYVDGDIVAIHGGEPDTDWDETWSVQEMNDQEWTTLKSDLREKCMEWSSLINANPTWENPDWMRGTISSVAHVAYHLGAVRQLSATLIDHAKAANCE